jgi:hypothetical protein
MCRFHPGSAFVKLAPQYSVYMVGNYFLTFAQNLRKNRKIEACQLANELPILAKHAQRNMKNLAIVLIILGAIMTTVTGFSFVTKKKVVDLGSVEINSTEKTPVYWSPITGGIILIAGVALLVASKKK